MTRFTHARRVWLSVAAAVVVAGGALFGVQVAGARTPASQPTGLDHFTCYKATATGFKAPPGVRLVNQFAPNGFVPVIGKIAFHCNPTQKTIPGAVFPINNPNAHLACFKITATQAAEKVQVQNQFGTAILTTSSPTLLCLPSWKSLTGPPNQTPNQPPGLDHFTCYPVKYFPGSKRFRPPAGITLQDQFTTQPIAVTVGLPKLLCLPTEKILPTGQTYPITNPNAHLLCFAVSQTPIITHIFDQNQFGQGPLTVRQTSTLCLPSFKKIVP